MSQSNINNEQNKLNLEILNLKKELQAKNEIIKQKDSIINQKDEEIQRLTTQINSNINQSNNPGNKWGFAIKFKSVNSEIDHAIVANEQDTIAKLEEEIYNEYPKFKDLNTFLTCNGNILKRFRTVGENKVKKGDTILVNIFDEDN